AAPVRARPHRGARVHDARRGDLAVLGSPAHRPRRHRRVRGSAAFPQHAPADVRAPARARRVMSVSAVIARLRGLRLGRLLTPQAVVLAGVLAIAAVTFAVIIATLDRGFDWSDEGFVYAMIASNRGS